MNEEKELPPNCGTCHEGDFEKYPSGEYRDFCGHSEMHGRRDNEVDIYGEPPEWCPLRKK